MGGLFGSVTLRGNRITDAIQQTATVGIPIPFGYGKFSVAGNIVANSPLRERVIRRRQGKGGVRTEDYEYTCDYAIAFAERIYGYWTIKRAGKVVYSSDPNTPPEDRAFAQKWLESATLYYGDEAQEPDSTLEAIYGVGQVSAMKGLSYIVVENDNVTANGGAIWPYEAVVVGSVDLYLTTPPYPIEIIEDLGSNATLLRGQLIEQPFDELVGNATLRGGQLRNPMVQYTNWPPEELASNAVLASGTLTTPLRSYTNWPPEELAGNAAITGGTIANVLIVYGRYQPEELSGNATLTGGSLT
ncbi:MAG: hypothetical protein DDT26_00040 [Dehalococcoidia bacterium]|nr:hypothetical protein [Chloroflexota bacterium]